jgi:hypothetical protein
MKKKKRTASPALGCLFWAALAIVLVAVALAVREPVLRNVRKVLGLSQEDSAESAGTPAAARPAEETPAEETPAEETPAAPSAGASGGASTRPAAPPPEASVSGSTAATGSAVTKPAASPPATATGQATRTRAARLWFAKVDDEGAIELAPVTRSLPAGDSPLRDALAALLAGPTAAEAGAGVVSLVPAGTVVRSVTVKGDTATIDFSEQFRFNALGVEGLQAQLRQVVWVATEFPTVSRVQVLIEGKRVDYLAPEGAAVGSALGRDSDFQ